MCKTVDAPTEAEYFYTQFDQYGTDTQVKETVKIEPKLKNVIGSANCQIHLTIFTNPQKTQSKSGGSTETGTVDPNTNIISFNKFFIMEYYFEKDQLNLE